MATKLAKDEVELAAAAVRRGIGRLVALLGSEDRAVIDRAAVALGEFGAAAVVGPLVAVLPRAQSPRHRLAIMGALLAIGTMERAAVTRALSDAARRETDPYVRARASAALTALILSGMAPTA